MNNPDKEHVYTQIATIISETLTIPLSEIKPTSSFESLGADSLDMLEIIMKLEETFSIEINDDEAATIATVQEAVDKIALLLAQ